MMDYLRRTNRFDAFLFSAFSLVAGGFFGVFGVSGFIQYLHGSRSAAAEPVAWGIGIGTALGLTYFAVRLLLRWDADEPLLPNVALLIFGLGAIPAAVWLGVLEHDLTGSYLGGGGKALTCGGFGVASLSLWWRRVRSSNR